MTQLEEYSIYLPDELAMEALGRDLAGVEIQNCVIYLYGDLGAGKTTFARGFLRGLGYTGKVKSPTYALVESYTVANLHVLHFDLYRVIDAKELALIGSHDFFTGETICLIEWPEHGEGYLPKSDISCYFTQHQTGRCVKLSAETEWGNKIVSRLRNKELSSK